MANALKPCRFTFDGERNFHGFAYGTTWNGFDNVAVTPEVRAAIVAYFGNDDTDMRETNADLLSIEPDANGLISLARGYATQIVPGADVRFIVRDVATKGVDFLLWGDDDFAAAIVSLHRALDDGLEVELAAMPADAMDPLTARLILGS